MASTTLVDLNLSCKCLCFCSSAGNMFFPVSALGIQPSCAGKWRGKCI